MDEDTVGGIVLDLAVFNREERLVITETINFNTLVAILDRAAPDFGGVRTAGLSALQRHPAWL